MTATDKTWVDELGIFGGAPTFPEKLHVGRPNIGDRERLLERINDILDRRWLTNDGPYVVELERRVGEITGAKHCIAMCNATIALEIVARALDLRGEVIVPSFTFIATAHALQWQGITPVFADVTPGKHHIDAASVQSLITPRTTGIIGVHVWGHACDIDAIGDIARRNNLRVVYDAAHAFASSYKGQMIGSFGDAEVFSFHATKFLNSFEGGMVTTNNDELASKLRFMRNFGFSGYDQVDYIGTNGKMTEVSAAMGLTSLDSLDEFINVNYRNFQTYHKEIESIPGLKLFTYDEKERNNYQYIIVEVDDAVTNINRDQIIKVLHAENVLARRYFYPGCHRMEPYRSQFPHAHLLLKETDALSTRVISLPNGTALSVEKVHALGELLRMIVAHGKEITQRMQNKP